MKPSPPPPDHSDGMDPLLLAPCGMNCRLCLGYQREKNRCMGCRGDEQFLLYHCSKCSISHCDMLPESGFCIDCSKFPCRRIRDLDKRYREKYRMSMIANLQRIGETSPAAFALEEEERWRCKNCGAMLCVHREVCLNCGSEAVAQA